MSSLNTERMSLRVPNHLRYGEAVRAMLDALTKRLERETETEGLNAHVISAFNEAFNNVVEHACSETNEETVEIEIELSQHKLKIAITDRGQGFAINDVAEPDLEALPEGGLGLMIIRSFMSSVDYEQLGDHNVLTMSKDFTKPWVCEEGEPPVGG
jgi:anti-sigma regulatory factor (Ser/Thr protein kinase)